MELRFATRSKSVMNRQSVNSIGRLSAMAALGILLSACATIAPVETPPLPELLGQPHYDIESVDPLEISNEMKQFVATNLATRSPDRDRAWLLAYSMLDRNLFNFTYDPTVTLTAKEAFRARRGNCLTFSNMFIALAREAGLDAWYREVEIQPEWSHRDETLLVSMHVNAGTVERMNKYVIDVSGRVTRRGERFRKLDDREAEAQFYNNLGANALVVEDLAMAYAYFRKADETQPGLTYIWSNAGVVLNRNGQQDDAIMAYETALTLDGDHSVALNNLYTIYEGRGDMERAMELQREVEHYRRRNPYYVHYLAEVAFAENLLDEAIDYTNRAIRMEDREYRFHYTLAKLQYRTGRSNRAESSLERAIRLAPKWVETAQLVLPGEVPELPTNEE